MNKEKIKQLANEILNYLTISEILSQLENEKTKEDRFIRLNLLNDLRNKCIDISRN